MGHLFVTTGAITHLGIILGANVDQCASLDGRFCDPCYPSFPAMEWTLVIRCVPFCAGAFLCVCRGVHSRLPPLCEARVLEKLYVSVRVCLSLSPTAALPGHVGG